jgi:uncharacterized membrane protein HdeD (DUF308 family)
MALHWTPQPDMDASHAGGFGGWMLGTDLTGEELRRVRRALSAVGVAALIIGALAILLPAVASVTIALFIGWVLVAVSVAMAIQAMSHRAVLRGLEAVLTLIAGLYLIIFPLNGTVTITFVLAVWLFATGALSLLVAVQLGRTAEAWMAAISGVLSAVLGVLIATSLPSSAAWAIGLLVGIDLVFWGVRALFAARWLKGTQPAL